MTLQDIQKNLFRRLNYADSPEASVTTRLTMFVNQRYRRLMSTPALRKLREGTTGLTSVSGQSRYGLGFGVARILGIRDTTNRYNLTPIAFDTWRNINPNEADDTGTPIHYVPMGMRALFRLPAQQGLWASSSSAGDTTQGVVVTGSLAGFALRGVQNTTTTTLTGTTRVALASGNTFDDVSSISLTAVTVGGISIWDAAASGNLIGTIFPGRRNSNCYVLSLSPTPSSALTYVVDFEHEIVDLSNTWDEPALPLDFHDLLVMAALQDEYEHRDDSRFESAKRQYDERLGELKSWLYQHRSATLPIARPEFAPLGPWYPRQY